MHQKPSKKKTATRLVDAMIGLSGLLEEDVWAACERAIAVAYQQDPQGLVANRDRLAKMLFAPESIPTPQLLSSSRAPPHLNAPPPPPPTPARPQQSSGTTTTATITAQVEPSSTSCTVLAMKERLVKAELSSEGPVVEALLRDLEGVHITMDLLKATQIGRVVSGLRKHPSQSVAALAKRQVKVWKRLVDHAVATASLAPCPETTTARAQATCPTTVPNSSEVKRSAPDRVSCLLNSSCGSNYYEKLESSKRRLKLSYQREETAKRQHTIHILRPHELPAPKKANVLNKHKPSRKATACCWRPAYSASKLRALALQL